MKEDCPRCQCGRCGEVLTIPLAQHQQQCPGWLQDSLSQLVAHAAKCGGKVMVCGNGGLAAESEHFAAELMGTYGRPNVFIPCVSLTSNTALLTALANDLDYRNVFSHQVQVLGKKEDLFIGMTTSRSANILWALDKARECGVKTACLCSEDYSPQSDCTVAFPGKTPKIQEQVIAFLHRVALQAKELHG